MQTLGDFELLRAYSTQGREDAFALLVSRYVDLVYSAARRQVRHAQMAEDVTQVVFMKLAQKAGSFGPGVVLQGWLLRATRYAALDVLRSSARREKRERQVAEARARDVHSNEPLADEEQRGKGPGGESFEAIEGILDAALLKLGDVNRDAIVLRYFENKSFREVALRLGMEEEAARQRVSRSLRKLRELLARSGVEMTPERLGMVLLARGILPAPPHLAATVASAAIKSALAVAGSSTAKGAVIAMAWTKTKIAVAAALGVALLGGGAVVVNHVVGGGAKVVEITSTKGLPADNTTTLLPAPMSWNAPASKTPAYTGPAIQGVVVDAKGKPVEGAGVMISTPDVSVWVYPQPAGQGRFVTTTAPSTKTDRQGHFSMVPAEAPLAVVVRDAAGYAATTVSDVSKPMSITLQPWARVEGTVRVGNKPAAGARVQIAQYGTQDEWDKWRLVKQFEAVCDSNGHYSADRVVPGITYFAKMEGQNMLPTRRLTVDLAAGKSAVVNIGGNGRPVVGHLPQWAEGLSFRRVNIYAPQPVMDLPPGWDKMDAAQQQKLLNEIYKTEKYKAWQLGAGSMSADFDVNKDGTFRADDIPPGQYNLNVQLGQSERNSRYIETAGWGSTPFTVPPITSPSQHDEAIDLGEVKVTMEKLIKPGDLAPEIAGESLEGKPIHLSDFRGKYILLHLWSGDRSDSIAHIQELRPLLDWFGDDSRFVMLGANLDGSVEKAKASAKQHDVRWPQVLVGGWGDPKLPREYTMSPALMFLIDPEGKLLVKNADPPQFYQVLLDRLRPSTSSGVRVDFVPQSKSPSPVTLEPSEAMNAARTATFSVVDGAPQQGSGEINRLRDGLLPHNLDAPGENFFFAMGSPEGRFRVDLGAVMPLARVSSYSWHKESRGPQVYKLYGSDGTSAGFNGAPKIGTDPATCGWNLVATVDTRPIGQPPGGQYKVTITKPDGGNGALGRYRYLMFVTFPTETKDAWGHTFYSEITVTRGEGG